MVFDLRPPLGFIFQWFFNTFACRFLQGFIFAMFFNTFALNPSQGFLVYMISDLYSVFLRFFSNFAKSILPWPWASVLFVRLFLICHGFDLYYLIRCDCDSFFWQGMASISHDSFLWTCWMYLRLLRLNIFSVCSGVARLRKIVVAMFVNMFVHFFPMGLYFSRLTTSFCSNSCPGLHSINKSSTCVDFQTYRRPQTCNYIFLVVALGLVEASGIGLISAQEASFANSFSIFCGLDPTQFLIICLCS